MKRPSLLTGLLLGVYWLALGIPTAGLAAFSKGDLAGTWHIYIFSDYPFANDPFWDRGTVTINSGGGVIGGSLLDSDGGAVTITGGSVSLNTSGVLLGSLALSDATTITISHGKMDANKSSGALVGSYSHGYLFKASLFKAGGTFSASDVEGSWYFYVFSDDPVVNDPGWSRGTLTLNASGAVTGGSVVDSEGGSATITGGSVSLNTNGVMSGSLTSSDGGTVTISEGKMDASKTMSAFVGTDSGSSRFSGSMIKAGGSFGTANLAGTWHFYNFWDSPLGNDPGWDRGTLVVNSSGVITDGTLADSNGFSGAVTGGALSLNGNGVLSGSYTAGGITYTISQGKVDVAKTALWYVGIDSFDYRFQGTASKAELHPRSDFDGDGTSDIGVFRNGGWYLDLNGNDQWNGCGVDGCYVFGLAGDRAVVGDWTGSGQARIGVYRGGGWSLDLNGNGEWNGCGVDGCYVFGLAGDQAVVGDWDGSGAGKIGMFRNGGWYLDLNGNDQWDGCGVDGCHVFGLAGDQAVVGDWTGSGQARIGVYRDGGWYLDLNGNGVWDGCGVDGCYVFGLAGDQAVVGDWTGSGQARIGVYRDGGWYLDLNGNGEWDGCGVDRCAVFGLAGDIPAN